MLRVILEYPLDELTVIKKFLNDVKFQISEIDKEETSKLDYLEDDNLAIRLLERQEEETKKAFEKFEEFKAMVELQVIKD